MVEQVPTVLWWRSLSSGEPFGPLYASFFKGGDAFAMVDKMVAPHPGWLVELRYLPWDRRRRAVFPSELKAKHAVERWAAHHWRSVAGDDSLQDRPNARGQR